MNLSILYQKIGFLRLSLCLICIYGLLQIHYGEKVGLRNGRGWDGVTYAFYVQHFDSLWDSGMLNKAHLLTSDTLPITSKKNRFLASMLVHHGMKVLHKPLEPTGIVRSFEYHNLAWALLAVLAWYFITKKLGLPERDKWLGFILLFGNFAFLKNKFYNPVNTDMIAYCLIIIQIAFFFYRFHWGMILTGLLGAFVWQPITIYAYLMLLFPFNILVHQTSKAWSWNTFIVVFILLIFGLGFWNDWQLAQETGDLKQVFSQGFVGTFGQSPVSVKYFYLSVFLAWIFTIFYFRILVRNIAVLDTIKSTFSFTFSKKFIIGLVYSIVLFSLVKLGNQLFSPDTQEVTSGAISGVLNQSTSNPLAIFTRFVYNHYAFHKPLEFYIAHITFFGLGYLIAGLYFHRFSKTIRENGGLAIVLVFLVSYSGFILNPQSRIGTVFAPFVLLYSILIIKELNLKYTHYFIIIILNLLISKVWYPVGDFMHDFDKSYARYFMNWGGWMNLQMLIIQGGSFILISIYLIWIRKTYWQHKILKLYQNLITKIKSTGNYE